MTKTVFSTNRSRSLTTCSARATKTAARTPARVTPAGPSCTRMRSWADGPSSGSSRPGSPAPSPVSPASTTKWRQRPIGFLTSSDSQPCHDWSKKLDRFYHLWTIMFICKTVSLCSVSSTVQNEKKVNYKKDKLFKNIKNYLKSYFLSFLTSFIS